MTTRSRSLLVAAIVVYLIGWWAPPSPAQDLGSLLSPGPLSSPHAHLEGIKSCDSCHEPGKGVSAKKCLSCHKPIAERIAAKTGVHREVTDECSMCHSEHAGRDADIRPIDLEDFDHLEETGYALDGKHADVGADCSKCHKTRSFLTLTPECASCHRDPHGGTLGAACITCHATSATFSDSGRAFDHSTAAYQLEGAHTTVECRLCHIKNTYRGLSYTECSDCHVDPHRGSLGATCASCHVGTAAWATTNVDHAKTAFPLDGKHAEVACASCHGTGQAFVGRPKHDQCSTCHGDAHAGNFTEDCATCHTVSGFAGGSFDHTTRTEFPLRERHAEIQCIACHKQPAGRPATARPTIDFRGLSTACESCHRDPHNGDLGFDCASCHGARAFKVSSFEHPASPEFFRGKHATADCSKCHTAALDPDRLDSMVSSRTYRGLSTTCASCHSDPHLGQFDADCSTCHAVEEVAFDASLFHHDSTDFELTGRHATAACETCHKKESGEFPTGSGEAVRFTEMSNACANCHRDVHLGELGSTCQSCHNAGSFSVESYTHRGDSEFFLGEHQAVQCESCHDSLADPSSTDPPRTVLFPSMDGSDCAACHDDVHKGTLGPDCAACHTNLAPFASASRAFHKDALMPLEGRHLAVPCAECHLGGQIEATPTRCYDCHWVRRQDDPYRTALGVECEQCHRPTSWTAVNWDHGGATGVPLTGAHAGLDCETCHTGGQFHGGTPSDCVACHLGDYQRAEDPDHVAGGLPTDCQLCHRPTDGGWGRAGFNHATFPLVGSHATLDCAECHSNGVYQGLPAECVDCHGDDHQRTTNPNHNSAGFGTECETCHRPSDPSWQDGQYPHSIYPLVASHVAQPCNACHASNVFGGLPSECVDCHISDYRQTTDPNHVSANFPTDCELCHSAGSPTWRGAQFDHTTFQLAGAHTTLDCAECHSNGVYQGLPSDCVDCHISDYQETNDPDHDTAGFPTDCVLCHSATSPTWDDANFNHTTFQLAGAHTTLDCAECHSSGVYQGLPSDCVDCHISDYRDTDDPDHAASGFPTDCVLCHSATSPTWDDANFNHTTFQLVGAHTTLDCAQCHSSGVYQGLPAECVDCHSGDHQQTSNPNHLAAGFETDCETCHRGSDPTWQDGQYPHSIYPLVASHVAQPCNACHASNVFGGLPSECVDCHLGDYQEADDPDHVAGGFPTDCELCHSTTSPTWDGASFDHSTFQLAGAHTTLDCAECHSSGVYQGLPSDCVDCHLSDYQQTDDPNHAAAGFPTDCELCHSVTSPTWDGATFNHSSFQLVGAHTTLDCAQCHSSGVYQGLPSDCVDCHLQDYQQTDDPNHAAAGFPTDCELCHRSGDLSWDQGDFNHLWFPINSGAHRNFECSECHPSGGNFALFTCTTSCHPRSEADEDHDEVPGYVYNSAQCYSCHPDGQEDFGRPRPVSSHASR